METDGWSDDTSSDDCTRKTDVRYVIEKKEQKRMINKGIFDSVWIKDLPMLYYSILDDELI